MKRVLHDRSQAMQRIKVGAIGLAAVILLIGLASLLFSGVPRDRELATAGGGNAAAVANMASIEAPESDTDEPLADLGVAPGSASVGNDAAAPAR